jgi:hypothetical protein
MAEDVEAFIAEKRLERPTLIGHSMFVTALETTFTGSLISSLLQGRQSCHGSSATQSPNHICAHTR